MSIANSSTFWTVALLIVTVLFIYMVYMVIRKGVFRKAEITVFSQDAFGWHLAFTFLIGGLLLSRLPEMMQTGIYTIQGDVTKSVLTEGIKLISIFFGISTVFIFVIYYLAYGILKVLHQKTSLKSEVTANNVGYILQHAALMLVLYFIVQLNFYELCQSFLPKTDIPFYR